MVNHGQAHVSFCKMSINSNTYLIPVGLVSVHLTVDVQQFEFQPMLSENLLKAAATMFWNDANSYVVSQPRNTPPTPNSRPSTGTGNQIITRNQHEIFRHVLNNLHALFQTTRRFDADDVSKLNNRKVVSCVVGCGSALACYIRASHGANWKRPPL